MPLAIIETTGSGDLKGVWVAEADGPDPDVAFLDPLEELMAEKMLGEAAAALEGGDQSWDDFLLHLVERQNLITVQRVQIETHLPARALLDEVRVLWPLWRSDS